MLVCHRCDLRCCVNPDHLFLGTNDENMADMVDKGRARAPLGRANGNSKLTEAQVRAIREDARSAPEIASDHHIGRSAVGMIKRGERWGWLQ